MTRQGARGVAVVGAGPAGLACALALRCQGLDTGLAVMDPAGDWLTKWDGRFAQQEIPHLRSPAVHHPHPDPFALLATGGPAGLVPSGGTNLPTTERFRAFVGQVVTDAGLADVVKSSVVTGIETRRGGTVVLRDDDGGAHQADRVVLATNSRRGMTPAPLEPLVGDERLVSSESACVANAPAGGRVAIVGGGLSAAHLALGALRRGSVVTLVARRRLTVRRFDVHPSWLGPRQRRPFEAEPDPVVRRRLIDAARGGGSIPPSYRRRLARAEESGCLGLVEGADLVGVEEHGGVLVLCLDQGRFVLAEEVWLATGGRVDARSDPLLAPLLDRHAVRVVDGLPVLAPDLSLPGTNVHVVGFGAALVVGPTAGNLVGQRRGAMRIAAAVRGTDPDHADRIVMGPTACPGRASQSTVGRASAK